VSFAQGNASGEKKETPEVFTIVEEQAEFPGGISAMMKFVQANLTYPEKARNLGLGGKVFVKFIVSETGAIEHAEIIKGSGYDAIDAEALRVVGIMPQWKAARMSGRNVKCYFNLPLSFILAEPYYTYNLNNVNSEYKTLTNLIFNGKADEAFLMINKLDNNEKDADFLYNKAVLLYYSKEKRNACTLFKKVTEVADSKTSVYTNSNKFINQYCN
jgi:TonB family protein